LSDYRYIGNELEVFSLAFNWKKYLKDQLSSHIGSNVLEVGSGPGYNTEYLVGQDSRHWVCLEPDGEYIAGIHQKIISNILPPFIEPVHGTIEAIPASRKFDTILYLDVLEHIEDDRDELLRAIDRLETGGRLIMLMPAFSMLFSNFDRNIGHYRRYTRKSLEFIIPEGMEKVRCHYLDACSIPVSLAARYIFTAGTPSAKQIRLWDSVFIPASRRIDPIIGYTFGKSLIGIWKKN
jgi:SAM-dependent methyltransferase